MPRLFKPTGRKETLSERITRWVVKYPSLALGFLPIIGGTISTPMQIHEIERDQAQIRGWRRVALASVLTRSRTALPSANFSASGPLSSSLTIATGREPRKVVDKHLERIELMRRAVQHPTFNVRVARQTALQRGRALAHNSWASSNFFRQLRADAIRGRTEYASRGFNLGQRIEQARALSARRRAINRRA